MKPTSKEVINELSKILDATPKKIKGFMTPKEKAEYLVDKFYQTTPNEAWINEPIGLSEEYTAWKQAKKCALIAVDEIMQHALNAYHNEDIIKGAKLYWNEVRKEIEKL